MDACSSAASDHPMKLPLICLGMLLCSARSIGATAPAESDAVRAATERYRTCATLSLPDNLQTIANPRVAAERALDLCQKKRLALVGQYALDNPGTRRTAEFADDVRRRVAGDLAAWIGDMKSLGVQGPR